MGPRLKLIDDYAKTFVASPRRNVLLQWVIRVSQDIPSNREARDRNEEGEDDGTRLEKSSASHDQSLDDVYDELLLSRR